jgi:FHS family glucose/mannose:H+ symporter-like MFS transporter
MSAANENRPAGAGRLQESAFAGIFVFGIVMAVLGAILPSLFDRIKIDKAEAGGLFLFMNFAMLVTSIFFGPVVDRFGFKLFLIVSSLLVVFSFGLLAFSSGYLMVIIAAVILGLGGGGLNGGTNALTSDLNPGKQGSALNLLGIFFGFGALTIPFLIGTLLEWAGLVRILILAAILGLIPFVMFATQRFPRPKQPQGFPLRDAKRIAGDPLLWLCAFILFFQSGNEFTLGGWISTYLQEGFGLKSTAASLALAGYWALIMAGRLVASRIVHRTGHNPLVLGSAALSLAAAVLLVIAPAGGPAVAGVLLIGLGFAAIYPTTLATAGARFASVSGTAFSVIFTVALCGGMLSPWLAGAIAKSSTLRRGLFIPVVNCVMIVVLQLVLNRASKKPGLRPFAGPGSIGERIGP